MHHVSDNYAWEVPGGGPMGLAGDANIKSWFGDSLVFNVGGHELDLTPTKLTIQAVIAAILLLSILLWSMRKRGAAPKGKLQTSVEILSTSSSVTSWRRRTSRTIPRSTCRTWRRASSSSSP